jgi:hypothetical protein
MKVYHATDAIYHAPNMILISYYHSSSTKFVLQEIKHMNKEHKQRAIIHTGLRNTALRQ